jgi:hypothetical protein
VCVCVCVCVPVKFGFDVYGYLCGVRRIKDHLPNISVSGVDEAS